MKQRVMMAVFVVLFCLLALNAGAHFQVVKPSTDIVTPEGDKTVRLDIRFTHPMEQGPIMDMGQPQAFGVQVGNKRRNLIPKLEEVEMEGKTAFESSFEIRRPGDHLVYLTPAPYWEPAEGKMIIHHTKVVVNAMGAETGWDHMVALPVEIEPLVRPYGLWTGNQFRGIVKKDGEPVPFAEIEVEYYNEGGRVEIPSAPYVTQVIKADKNGVFSYVMPRAGWWGFAALVEADDKMKNPDGEMVPVELGGLMWVRTRDMD